VEIIDVKEDYFYAKRATYIGDFKILVEFENGEIKVLDCSPWRNKNLGDFKELKKEENFKQFYLDTGIITWHNGYDIAPEYTYEKSKPVVFKEGKSKHKLVRIK